MTRTKHCKVGDWEITPTEWGTQMESPIELVVLTMNFTADVEIIFMRWHGSMSDKDWYVLANDRVVSRDMLKSPAAETSLPMLNILHVMLTVAEIAGMMKKEDAALFIEDCHDFLEIW